MSRSGDRSPSAPWATKNAEPSAVRPTGEPLFLGARWFQTPSPVSPCRTTMPLSSITADALTDLDPTPPKAEDTRWSWPMTPSPPSGTGKQPRVCTQESTTPPRLEPDTGIENPQFHILLRSGPTLATLTENGASQARGALEAGGRDEVPDTGPLESPRRWVPSPAPWSRTDARPAGPGPGPAALSGVMSVSDALAWGDADAASVT